MKIYTPFIEINMLAVIGRVLFILGLIQAYRQYGEPTTTGFILLAAALITGAAAITLFGKPYRLGHFVTEVIPPEEFEETAREKQSENQLEKQKDHV